MAPRIAPDTRNRTQQAQELRVTSGWQPGLTGIQDFSPEDQQLTRFRRTLDGTERTGP